MVTTVRACDQDKRASARGLTSSITRISGVTRQGLQSDRQVDAGPASTVRRTHARESSGPALWTSQVTPAAS